MSEEHPEIIIIKRHKAHEEEHHGGAWKIAFADFMTAMMAFFLVLWIINATDKNTKTIIARYFNPVRLENPAKAAKGVHGAEDATTKSESDKAEQGKASEKSEATKQAASSTEKPGAAPAAEGKSGAAPAEKGNPPAGATSADEPAAPPPKMTESVLFKDPHASLDRILAEDAAISGSRHEDVFKDPFQVSAAPPAGIDTRMTPDPSEDAAAPNKLAPASDAAQTSKPASDAPLARGAQASGEQDKGDKQTAAAAQLRQEIERQPAFKTAHSGPAVDVKATKDGILISLTDQWNFSMFASGSAEPQPQAIKAVDGIAKLLKDRSGEFVVRGHTDARPYKTGAYDNWRLSSARAQMVYYILTRAGLPEKRFLRVEGYADHQLKERTHPLDPKNRYIEILVREAGP